MSEGTITNYLERANVARYAAVLEKHKASQRGKAYVILVDKEQPKTTFEIEANKFKRHFKRYSKYTVVGNGIWE
jgi:hypothetical protein